MKPYGQSNPQPLFEYKGVKVLVNKMRNIK